MSLCWRKGSVLPRVWGSVAVPATVHCAGQPMPPSSTLGSSSGHPLFSCWGQYLLEAAHLPGTSPSQTEQLLCVPGLCFWSTCLSCLGRAELFHRIMKNCSLSVSEVWALPKALGLFLRNGGYPWSLGDIAKKQNQLFHCVSHLSTLTSWREKATSFRSCCSGGSGTRTEPY